MNKCKGFTLIELVLVLVIVSILSVTAIPRFFDALNFSARNFYDETLNSFRYAQKIAIVMGCDVQVATTANSVKLLLRSNCRAGNFTLPLQDPGSGQPFIKIAPSNVTITSVDMPIYFDRVGRAHKNAGQLTNSSLVLAGKTISIIAETGFVYEP